MDEILYLTSVPQDNVMISAEGKPLLADFGISLIRGLDMYTVTCNPRGTIRWFAPELLIGEGDGPINHTKETDIWAFGMTLLVRRVFSLLVSRVSCLTEHRFEGNDVSREAVCEGVVLSLIAENQLPESPACLETAEVYLDLWNLCNGCWSKVPTTRLTTSTIRERLQILQARDALNFVESGCGISISAFV